MQKRSEQKTAPHQCHRANLPLAMREPSTTRTLTVGVGRRPFNLRRPGARGRSRKRRWSCIGIYRHHRKAFHPIVIRWRGTTNCVPGCLVSWRSSSRSGCCGGRSLWCTLRLSLRASSLRLLPLSAVLLTNIRSSNGRTGTGFRSTYCPGVDP